MIIIGEKINGSVPEVAAAIAGRDKKFIQELARVQAEAGADFIDCCAAVLPEQEADTLKWMVECIQEVTDVPISLDSASPDVLSEVYGCCKCPGLFNSVSAEGRKLDKIFSIMAKEENKGWEVIALLLDEKGIPKTAGERLRLLDFIMEKAREYGIDSGRIHIDPLVEMLCISEDGVSVTLEVISAVRAKYPKLHITGAISNVSYQLPARRLLNTAFLVLAMQAGLDGAILDPTNEERKGLIYATEALLGKDENCMEYIRAYRDGFA